MTEVYVLWWKYSDGSAAGIAAVYSDKDLAESICRLLQAEGMKTWELQPATVDRVIEYPR